MLNYEQIVKEMKDKTLRTIWQEMDIPCKFVTFKRAVLKYKATGHKTALRLRGAAGQVYMFEDDIKNLSDLEQSVKKRKNDADILDAIVAEKTWAQLRIEDISSDKLNNFIEELKTGIDIKNMSPQDALNVFAIVENLRKKGYCIDFDGCGIYKMTKNIEIKPTVVKKDWNGSKHIRIGVVSDTHLGSKHAQLTFLEELYDRYKELGITDVYHCGDITDGMYPNRSDQIYELHAHGADAQVDYVVNYYPFRKGIATHFITGNHDFTFVRNTGYNIGPAIAMRRADMNYLGMFNAKVWLTPKCDLELNHPLDGSAYALSYSIQKTIDALSGGEKPKILCNGHHHKYLTMFYRNIHAIEVPSVQAQTPYMKGKRLAAHVGGLVLDIYVDEEGTIERFACEMIPLYKCRENDYRG